MADQAGTSSILGLAAGPTCTGCGRTFDIPDLVSCPSCGLTIVGDGSGRISASGGAAPPNLDLAALERLLRGSALAERYELVRLLGHGGMGAVFVARDLQLERQVALKVVLGVGAADAARFAREGQLLARLQHPMVLRVFAVEVAADLPVLVMELLAGRGLKSDLVSSGRYHPARVREVGRALLDGLAAAHQLNIVHRDLKLENVLMLQSGDLKILDFGLARQAGTATHGLTETGAIMGSPCYMSPEQCRGTPVDARTDLYSLGVMLYELSSGQLPFTGAFAMEILVKHMNEEPPPLPAVVPGYPEALWAVIAKALSKDPGARHANATAMQAALAAVGDLRSLASGKIPRPGSASGAMRRPVSLHARNSVKTAVPSRPSSVRAYRWGGALALALGFGFGMVVILARGAFRNEPPAPASVNSSRASPAPSVKARAQPASQILSGLEAAHTKESPRKLRTDAPLLFQGLHNSVACFHMERTVAIQVWTAPVPLDSAWAREKSTRPVPKVAPLSKLSWTPRLDPAPIRAQWYRIPIPWTEGDGLRRLVLITREPRSASRCVVIGAWLDIRATSLDIPELGPAAGSAPDKLKAFAERAVAYCEPAIPARAFDPLLGNLGSVKLAAAVLAIRGQGAELVGGLERSPSGDLVQRLIEARECLGHVEDRGAMIRRLDLVFDAKQPTSMDEITFNTNYLQGSAPGLTTFVAREPTLIEVLKKRALGKHPRSHWVLAILQATGLDAARVALGEIFSSWSTGDPTDPHWIRLWSLVGLLGQRRGDHLLPALAKRLPPGSLLAIMQSSSRLQLQPWPSLQECVVCQRDKSIPERVAADMDAEGARDSRWSWFLPALVTSGATAVGLREQLALASLGLPRVAAQDREPWKALAPGVIHSKARARLLEPDLAALALAQLDPKARLPPELPQLPACWMRDATPALTLALSLIAPGDPRCMEILGAWARDQREPPGVRALACFGIAWRDVKMWRTVSASLGRDPSIAAAVTEVDRWVGWVERFGAPPLCYAAAPEDVRETRDRVAIFGAVEAHGSVTPEWMPTGLWVGEGETVEVEDAWGWKLEASGARSVSGAPDLAMGSVGLILSTDLWADPVRTIDSRHLDLPASGRAEVIVRLDKIKLGDPRAPGFWRATGGGFMWATLRRTRPGATPAPSRAP